jgi:hypothetical protein
MGGVMSDRDGPERPEARLEDVFEDLEQQAAGIHLAERDAELADRARGEYATVSFASRVHASVGRQVSLSLGGGDVVEGSLVQAGVDWCLVTTSAGGWLVRLAAVETAYGLSARAVPEAARPAVARLGFGSALHRVAGEAQVVLLHTRSGERLRVRVLRIGADFVEAEPAGNEAGSVSPLLLPVTAIRAVRTG